MGAPHGRAVAGPPGRIPQWGTAGAGSANGKPGMWVRLWRAFLGHLDARGRLQWEQAFIDATFAPAKKGALPSETPGGAKARSAWWWSTARVYLWEFASPRPPRRSLARRCDVEHDPVPRAGGGAPRRKPLRLIADRGYDSDRLRHRLAARGITFISPYRSMRVNRPYEDHRLLRRYRHRWIIERTFAWLASSPAERPIRTGSPTLFGVLSFSGGAYRAA